MNASLDQAFPLYFPFFFVLLWFAVTVLLGFMSGWYFLMRRFPDRAEAPLRAFKKSIGVHRSRGRPLALDLKRLSRRPARGHDANLWAFLSGHSNDV